MDTTIIDIWKPDWLKSANPLSQAIPAKSTADFIKELQQCIVKNPSESLIQASEKLIKEFRNR